MKGRVAIISGAARGQGEAIARRFHREGAIVIIADVLDDDGRSLAAELGERAVFRHLDVRDPGGWRSVVDDAASRFGHLDALVNNAGILRRAPLDEMDLDDYLAVVMVNQVGVFLGMQTVVEPMRRSGGGTIVNTSSIAATMGLPGLAAYGASKSAVQAMTRVAAIELAEFGIRVNTVVPGRVDTAMSQAIGDPGAGIPLGRQGTPQEIADAVLFLSSDASAFCTGAEIVLDGGVSAGPAPRRRRTPGEPREEAS